MKKSFSTLTTYGGEFLVPWLAAEGPLAYNPDEPPTKDYFFQYGWVLPGIFDADVNLREHYFFGIRFKDDAKFLFQFWDRARKGHVSQRYYNIGKSSEGRVVAPIAAYHHLSGYDEKPGSLLIQHGSYQWVSVKDQPHIENGQVLLYRGIQRARKFRYLRFDPKKLSALDRESWRKYLALQAKMLSDSVLSFNTIHDRTKRSETSHLRDGTWLSDKMATQVGLDITAPGFAKKFWKAVHQSYSLEPWVVRNKFGPHYVVFQTPLSNIRITTFFAGEAEARVIDPALLKVVDTIGCRVETL